MTRTWMWTLNMHMNCSEELYWTKNLDGPARPMAQPTPPPDRLSYNTPESYP